ncbi:MAG: hypothetical protein ACN6PF_25790 [Achromobacter veterisilvae]
MASSQPAGRFLVASFLALMAAHSAGVTAAEAGPADAAAVRFIVADGAAGTSVVRAWTKSETKEAATEAEAVIRRAASRIQTALNANDAEFFMGAGSQYVQKEWQLFTAQDVAYVFGVQGAKLKNPWIPSYSTCEHAGQALGDWYHFYRSNLSNGYSLNDLKVMPASRQAERDLWGSLSACKKAL